MFANSCTDAGRRCAARIAVTVLCTGAALVGGCVRQGVRATQAPEPRPSTGSEAEAVLHETVAVTRAGGSARYQGAGWSLTVASPPWQREDGGSASSLRLSREAEGVKLVLSLKVFAVRQGMPLERFLTGHKLWMMEPGGRRVEYHFDRERKEWSGYSVDGRQEVYYAFRAAGDRAYAIEEAATQGAVSAQAAAEFDRIMAAFRCEAR